MKILVVYFSHRGNTARFADELAWHCSADRERIRVQDAQTVLDRLSLLCRRIVGRQLPIAPPVLNPAAYDLVVIGTPVHGNSPSPAVRSYIAAHANEFRNVAFFCTKGRAGSERALAELQRLCGQAPVASITLDTAYADMPAAGERVRRFTSSLMGCAYEYA